MFVGLSKRTFMLVAAGALFAAGCGSTNPPCVIDLAEVDAARAEAQTATDALEKLQAERGELDRKIAEGTAERAELQSQRANLQAQIDELTGGGR